MIEFALKPKQNKMVDVAALIMNNLMYILIAIIVVFVVGIIYIVWKKEKAQSKAQMGMPKPQMPDVELTKMSLPTKTGMVTKGKLESAMTQNKQQQTTMEQDISKRRRVIKKSARRTTRRTKRRSTRSTIKRKAINRKSPRRR